MSEDNNTQIELKKRDPYFRIKHETTDEGNSYKML
jgi:hypothetical protein